MPLYELHAHTSECDLAAHATAAELVRLYHAAGYSGMVITDHYFTGFFSWFQKELIGADHRTAMARRLKGYYAAREEGEKLGFTVLPSKANFLFAMHPALDGGKIFFLLVNQLSLLIFRKQISAKFENYIHVAGFILLMGLMAVIMFMDVWKLFQ